MSNVGYDTWFPKHPSTRFVVKNVTNENHKWGPKGKRVRVFSYPINTGETRDLLAIPGVSEADIRHSLLKGELMIKLDPGIRELIVVDSDIDLLQFNDDQKVFLQSTGIVKGLEITASATIPFLFRQNAVLLGTKDGINRTYTTAEKFINGTFFGQEFRILIRHNGKGLEENIDYTLIESGGIGTGFDTIVMISFIPIARSRLLADYVIKV